MIKSCATIALVPEIVAGPWIYWDAPDISIPKAAKLGFDAVELFTASADAVDHEQLEQLCDANEIAIAAVGTGNPYAPLDYPFHGNKTETLEGRCILVVRAARQKGAIHIVASADGLATGSAVVESSPVNH